MFPVMSVYSRFIQITFVSFTFFAGIIHRLEKTPGDACIPPAYALTAQTQSPKNIDVTNMMTSGFNFCFNFKTQPVDGQRAYAVS